MALELFVRLCSLFGKAYEQLALLFIDEMEGLCADVLFTAGRTFSDRCRSGLRRARSEWLWGARGLEALA